MSEPRPEEIFDFGLRVAWYLCGCAAKSTTYDLRSRAVYVVDDILRGTLTLEDSPAEGRNWVVQLIEELRQKDDERSIQRLRMIAQLRGHCDPSQSDEEGAKQLLEAIERDGMDKALNTEHDESQYRMRVAEAQNVAKCIRKSEIARLRAEGMPEEWIDGWKIKEFLE